MTALLPTSAGLDPMEQAVTTVWVVEQLEGGEYCGTDSIWDTEQAATARADRIRIEGYYTASVVKYQLNATDETGRQT